MSVSVLAIRAEGSEEDLMVGVTERAYRQNFRVVPCFFKIRDYCFF